MNGDTQICVRGREYMVPSNVPMSRDGSYMTVWPVCTAVAVAPSP